MKIRLRLLTLSSMGCMLSQTKCGRNFAGCDIGLGHNPAEVQDFGSFGLQPKLESEAHRGSATSDKSQGNDLMNSDTKKDTKQS